VTPLILPDDGFDLYLPEFKYSDAAETETLATSTSVRASTLVEE